MRFLRLKKRTRSPTKAAKSVVKTELLSKSLWYVFLTIFITVTIYSFLFTSPNHNYINHNWRWVIIYVEVSSNSIYISVCSILLLCLFSAFPLQWTKGTLATSGNKWRSILTTVARIRANLRDASKGHALDLPPDKGADACLPVGSERESVLLVGILVNNWYRLRSRVSSERLEKINFT